MKDAGYIAKHFGDPRVLLGFMNRTRKPVFHKSNVFVRDIQYAIRDYFDTIEGEPIRLPEAERIAYEVVRLYVDSGVLRQVNNQAYRLEMPEFATPTDGTYAMLTIHGAPLAEKVQQALRKAMRGSEADPRFQERELKGGDVSPKGDVVAELSGKTAESGAPQEPHVDPQETTTNKPNPKVEHQFR